MNYEEKYKQALERARDLMTKQNPPAFDKHLIRIVFPELASEDDRIRKEIIDFLELPHPQFVGKRDHEKWIAWLEKQGESKDKGEISDGYHTFNELYRYRMLYNAAFFNMLPKEIVHKSKRHHDGEECFGGGWFVVMANLPTGQISNHYELKDWDLFQIPEKEIADEWDGHTPQEAAERLHRYLLEKQEEKEANQCSNCINDKGCVTCVNGNMKETIKSKFKVGDWIIDEETPNDVFYVIGVLEEIYKVIDIDGQDYHIPHCKADKQFHLWSIDDAKDGDVLETDGSVFIYAKVLYNKPYAYCGVDKYGVFKDNCLENNWSNSVYNIHPATDKQRDQLEKAIMKAGYEWDSNKKELKKIEVASKESEDDRIRKGIIRNLQFLMDRSEGFVKEDLQERIAWLEKQGNKIVDCPQNHQDVKYPNGGIVMEDFNGGEGFYKLHLDYLSKKQVEEVEEMVRMWNKESKIANKNIKNCIGECLTVANEQRFKDYSTTLKDCLAWLEKQGEQTTDKIESKFKVGDWVIKNGIVAQILDKQKYGFVGLDIDGKDFFCNYGHTDSMHLWSINDAKDGDVLVDGKDGRPFIFTGNFDARDDNPIAYCGINSIKKFMISSGSHWTFRDRVKPATKEQRDLLFSKMKEAGYEWNAEKKELKKMEHKKLDADKVIAWLVANISDFEYYVKLFKKDFGL